MPLSREDHFALGREAATSALKKLTGREHNVGKDDEGLPVFPKNTMGSISHSGGLAVCAAGMVGSFRAIGIDIQEITESITEKLIKRICSAEELEWAREAGLDELSLRGAALFSAKESVIKALQLGFKIRTWLSAINLHWHDNTGSFDVIKCDSSMIKSTVKVVRFDKFVLSGVVAFHKRTI